MLQYWLDAQHRSGHRAGTAADDRHPCANGPPAPPAGRRRGPATRGTIPTSPRRWSSRSARRSRRPFKRIVWTRRRAAHRARARRRRRSAGGTSTRSTPKGDPGTGGQLHGQPRRDASSRSACGCRTRASSRTRGCSAGTSTRHGGLELTPGYYRAPTSRPHGQPDARAAARRPSRRTRRSRSPRATRCRGWPTGWPRRCRACWSATS